MSALVAQSLEAFYARRWKNRSRVGERARPARDRLADEGLDLWSLLDQAFENSLSRSHRPASSVGASSRRAAIAVFYG